MALMYSTYFMIHIATLTIRVSLSTCLDRKSRSTKPSLSTDIFITLNLNFQVFQVEILYLDALCLKQVSFSFSDEATAEPIIARLFASVPLWV